jgi:hypothetical protein
MIELDLHGIRHHEVDRVVENFVLLEELPVKIITGNSPSMQSMACSVLERHELHWEYESFYNLGAIVVSERRI